MTDKGVAAVKPRAKRYVVRSFSTRTLEIPPAGDRNHRRAFQFGPSVRPAIDQRSTASNCNSKSPSSARSTRFNIEMMHKENIKLVRENAELQYELARRDTRDVLASAPSP